MTKAAPTEGDVKAEIKRLLHEHGWHNWMPPANTYGSHGQSDHLAVRKCGSGHLFFAIEAKLKKDTGTANQRRFMAAVREQGALAAVVNQERLPQFEVILQEISRAYPHRYWHHLESSCVFLTADGEDQLGDGLVHEIERAEYERLKIMYAGESADANLVYAPEVLEAGVPNGSFGRFGWRGKPGTTEPASLAGETGSTSVEQGTTPSQDGAVPIPAKSGRDKPGQKRTRTKAAAGEPSRSARKPRK